MYTITHCVLSATTEYLKSHFTHVIVSVCNHLLQLHLNTMTVDMLCIIHVARPSSCVHFQLSYYNVAVRAGSGAKKYRYGTLSFPSPPSLRFLSSLFPPSQRCLLDYLLPIYTHCDLYWHCNIPTTYQYGGIGLSWRRKFTIMAYRLTFSHGCIVKVNTCELFNAGQIVLFSNGFKICSG